MKKIWMVLPIGAALLVSHVGLTQNTTLSTDVRLAVYHDDQFVVQEEGTELDAAVYNPVMRFEHGGLNYQSHLELSTNVTKFYGSDLQDRRNFSGIWDLGRDWESWGLGLASEYSEKYSEEILELGDEVFSDAQTVDIIAISPNFYVDWTERSRLELQYEYSLYQADSFTNEFGVTFDADITDQHAVTTSLSRRFSPKSSGGISVIYTAYRPEDDDEASADLVGAAFSSEYLLSEHWVFEGYIGAMKLTTSAEVDDPRYEFVNDGDMILASEMELKFEGVKNFAQFSFASGSIPRLDGVVDVQSQASIRWEYAFSERVRSALILRYIDADQDSQKTYFAGGELSWQWSEHIMLQGNYRYLRYDSAIDPDSGLKPIAGDSNRISLGLTYSFDTLRFSL